MKRNDISGDMPLGLGMALAQNMEAMRYYAQLPDNEQQQIIAQTHRIQSKEEMQEFVNNLAKYHTQ